MSERIELMRARHCGWWPCPRIRVLNVNSMNTFPRKCIWKRTADLRKPVAYKVYERERQNCCVRTQVSCSAAYLSRSHKRKGVRRGEGGNGYEGNVYC